MYLRDYYWQRRFLVSCTVSPQIQSGGLVTLNSRWLTRPINGPVTGMGHAHHPSMMSRHVEPRIQKHRKAEYTDAEHRNAEILKRKIQQNWLVLPINTWVQSLPWLLPNPSPKTLSRPSLVVIQSIGNCRRDICKGGSIFSLWLQQLDMSQGVFEFISWDWFRWRWQWVTRRWRWRCRRSMRKTFDTQMSLVGRVSPDKITTNELNCTVLH